MVDRPGAFSDMVDLQKEVNKLFEHLAHLERGGTELGVGEWFPSIDVFEVDDKLVVKVEAPGMSKNELTVVFHGHKLVVSGEKKQPRDEKAVNSYLCLERSFGKFNRTIYIDEAVELPKAAAVLDNGVLTITVPRLKDRRGTEFHLAITEQD